MHPLDKQHLKRIGVNPCLLPLIEKKHIELNEIRATLESFPELCSFNTKTGDVVDRANFEAEIKTQTVFNKLSQLRLRKVASLLNTLQDPNYDGYCTACEGTILSSRIDKANSTICIHCAELAEN